MTLAEYMDPVRFPESTQKGLAPRQQLMIDAVNYDDIVRLREDGPLKPDLEAVARELDEKHAARADVMKELKAAGG